ncbi:hypothetical protein PVL29_005915 [Vitis rotundifolia]|uniref:non-specific serine/threonine protein kinase n=1 Tax=Vitis rotundifolia TaxID=103349 RepID=A0AA39A3L6_VITRO|nr:hypothetical protein PVL29_005915 [Vitis rotundifolia]
MLRICVNSVSNFHFHLFCGRYRLKHRRVNIRAVKHWCRQILWGLLYLHNHKPPVIHRDLKCDNIFVNGNQGEVKIGDLGLAAILRKSHAAHCVGTPEFMAPEVYEEEYNELVDIYSFGMCILEMVTFEYPYSECTHPAQIYKKVISGKKPDALYKVKDPEVRQFIEKCLATVTLRLSARELLKDPFLQSDDYGSDLRPIEYQRDLGEVGPLPRLPHYDIHHSYSSLMNGYSGYPDFELENRLDCHPVEFERNEIDLFTYQEDEHLENVDISIEGRKRDDHGIFLRLRISDKEGRFRNIYFPFDMETDTALSVAMEMVSELDITDQDVTKIADMIDDEIASLVPGWKMGLGIEESQNYGHGASFCHHCASNGSPLDYVSPNNPGTKNLEVLQCSRQGCAAVHGRFEEITYRVEGSEQCVTEGAPVVSSQSDGMLYADIWAQREGPELSSEGSREIHSDEEHESLDKSIYGKEERVINIDNQSESNARNSFAPLDDYENEIRQELRWLKAKYQMQLRELRDQQLGAKPKLLSLTPNSDSMEHSRDNKVSPSSLSTPLQGEDNDPPFKSFPCGKHFNSYFPVDTEKGWANLAYRRPHNREPVSESCSPDDMVTAKSFFTGTLLPQSLHRATSLPVDAVDF